MRKILPTPPLAQTGGSYNVTKITMRNQMPRIKGGFCGCRTEYVGPNPISNYAKFVAIEIAKGIFATAIVTAGGVAMWYCKEKIARKMGWIKDAPQPTPTKTSDTTSAQESPTPPTISSLGIDIDIAIKNGAPVKVCGDYIHEGDRAVFASGPGVGKTIAAGQLAICIGEGQSCSLFPGENESGPQRVLLIDAEQEEEDLFLRYGEMAGSIPANITRMSNCNFNSPEDACAAISEEVSRWNEKGTIIIDNITALFSLQSAEKVRNFYGMLRSIQASAKTRGFKLTLIIICHEAKSATKLTLKSIQGSGNIGNFATSVFALAHSALGENKRYFKVLKARRFPKPGNVYLLNLATEPYFHFENEGEISEAEATGKAQNETEQDTTVSSFVPTNGERKLSDAQIEEIKERAGNGESVNSLSKRFGVNRNTVKKYLKAK